MANPVTSILNPKGDYVFLYYVDKKQRLALDYIPVDRSQNVLSYAAQGTLEGDHVNNQSIAAVYFHGMPVVFGQLEIVKVSGEITTTKRVLAQLSPIVKAVANLESPDDTKLDERYNALAAINSTKQDYVWCYFLKNTAKEGAAPKMMLEEVSIFGNEVQIHHYSEIPDDLQPDSTTRLAALYIDQTHREVYYQRKGDDNSIYCYRIGNKSKPTPIADTGLAMKSTPLAVTRSVEGHVCLYYLSKPAGSDPIIQRVTRNKGTMEWAPSAGIMTGLSDKAVSETQLAVTQVIRNNKLENVVTFIHESEQKYRPARDDGQIE
ncbi:hypothetical protein QBC32DRAFT_347307 [Pseudoneurospora amorphoporcata]|uniref:Fucose-specific lectin n=1 Tax=Pseudoneurospora amorphoporcata TaxID=241081 RepID=A0AAN6NSE8_9PEZI|nr:hypothetical protein QBC32DRAFT_347307 [Pseudoneurospora amorphoporcata]